jgi:hypothetical protein
MSKHRLRCGVAMGLLAALLVAACATSNVLSVNYLLPARSNEIPGRSVAIAFEDARKDGAFLSPSARQELEDFTNVYALTVSKPGRSGELKGAYALGPLFTEILRYRLEDAGVKVLPPGGGAQLKLVLKEFRMDYGDRKWSASVAYDARLLRNGTLLSQQTVNGSAERVVLMKKTDAEKVLGELVSDAVNQMDLAALFKQAGL